MVEIYCNQIKMHLTYFAIMRRVVNSRLYCVSVAKSLEKVAEEKLDFLQLRHVSKVPDQPKEVNLFSGKKVEIDQRTVQLLERLALVNLDGEEALEILKSCIQFANKIESINIEGKKPLYTVLEEQSLHLREDQVNEGNCREEILKNAIIIEEDYFISPPGNIPLKQEAFFNKKN